MSDETGGEYVTLGYISGLYGVQGWVKVFSYTEPRQNILNYSPWYLQHDKQWRPVEVLSGRRHGDVVVARLEGYTDREAARALLKAEIAIRREQLPPLQGDQYYWNDLLGMRVVTRQGVELGRVESLMETGANDVLVVQETTAEGQRQERLIPFIRGQVVLSVEMSERVIIVDWDPDF